MEQFFSLVDNLNLLGVLFVIVLVFYIGYTFAIVYHLIRFGIGTKPKVAALVFFVGSMLLLILLFFTYYQLDSEILNKLLSGPRL
jgi:hypothetical protein